MAIELVPQATQWEARYTLPQPTTLLRFGRVDKQGNRASSWTPVDAAFSIKLEDGEEVVRRLDGASFDHVAFRMAPKYVTLEKDYAPFSPFGDGGMLVYTGRFQACPDTCKGGETYRLSMKPPAGMHAIAHGKVVDSVDFEDDENGTNLYVGRAEPVSTPDVVAVIDPTLPADVRGKLESLLPRLMSFYGKEFGVLPTRPMLFASIDAQYAGGGYGYQGGTLPGQVFVHRYGSNPAFNTPAFAARQDWFFAHEAAHLYQHYPSLADDGDSWIHEGGADALAAVALQALGEIDQDAVKARLQSSLDTCAAGIAKYPLKQAHVDGSFDSFYGCGFVMQMAVDAAARRSSKGACGLACVWRDFQAQDAAGMPWSSETFIAVAEKRTDATTAQFLRATVNEVSEQPAIALREGLTQAGWQMGP
jgi:hypothetical protein